MANIKNNRSRLMLLSWEIQSKKHKSRSQALRAAWAICLCEDIAVMYLTRKLNKGTTLPNRALGQFSLFNS